MGDVILIEEFQDRGDGQGARCVGLAHHDGGVGDHQRIEAVLDHFNRTGTIQEGPRLIEIFGGGDVDLGELRYSVGVGLSWLTALGPLGFSLAMPLNADSADDAQVFQFTLGQTF